MTEEEFFKWLETGPTHRWECTDSVIENGTGAYWVMFQVDAEEE